MFTFPFYPSGKHVAQVLKVILDSFATRDQVVRNPGQGVVRFVFAAAVAAGRVHAHTLCEPVVHLLAQSAVMLISLDQRPRRRLAIHG